MGDFYEKTIEHPKNFSNFVYYFSIP